MRESLVSAALQLLESDGADLSLRAVARAAGVSAMAPYRHFPDKTALLSAVAERGFALLHAKLTAADERDDPSEALLEQGLAYLAFARAHPALFRLMFAGEVARAVAKPDGPAGFDVLARRVASLAPGDIAAARLACWSMVHGLATLSLDGRLNASDPQHEREALALLVGAIGRNGQKPS
ncbi:regulatory protein TetR [Aurantimonas sp. 22II-16-19i]|nr:regulatory protein TetR [Aurantimonas sp. 22II-16-19i]